MSNHRRERREAERAAGGLAHGPVDGESVGLHGDERVIAPGSLSTPEDGLALERPEHGTLARRIAAARELKPVGRHFRPSWRRGLDATLDAIAAGRKPDEARRMQPPAGEPCRACWVQGRDRAVAFVGQDSRIRW
jgi:hypothetical protein